MGLFGSKSDTPNVYKLRKNKDIAGLTKALEHSDKKVRAYALWHLHILAKYERLASESSIGPLERLLSDNDSFNRSMAAETLYWLAEAGVASESSIEPLRKAYGTKERKKALTKIREVLTESDEKSDFSGMLKQQFKRLKRDNPKLATFIDQYWDSGQIRGITGIAEEKMARTQFDNQEHSYASIETPVCRWISTLPVILQEAKNWFARNYGAYHDLLEQIFYADLVTSTGCTTLCHIVYGKTQEESWVRVAIVPIPGSGSINTVELPSEFLTRKERRNIIDKIRE